jgi:aryl-alcohol dehydrogenase-like predicted oxidoreductase
MKERKLGQLKTPVSALGYGAMSFSDFYGPTDDEKSHAILKRCLDLGINHIDTSNVYGLGMSEKRIGSYLAKQGSRAQDFFKIATKVGITSKPDGTRYFDNSLAHIEGEVDKSLKRLGIEQVELLYIHRRDARVPIEEVCESMASIVKSGKVRQIGFSEIAPTSLEIAHQIHPVAAVQSEYSLSTRSPEMGLIQKADELGTSLVAFSPVGRSLLTDYPLDLETCKSLDFLKVNPRFQDGNYQRNISASDGFRSLASDMGVATSGLAIAWILAKGEHVLPIPGTRSVDHLNELASGAELSLTASDIETIETVLPIGWCHGDRYTHAQWRGPEKYC